MASTQTRWQIAGDYFENCNCNVVSGCRATFGACAAKMGRQAKIKLTPCLLKVAQNSSVI